MQGQLKSSIKVYINLSLVNQSSKVGKSTTKKTSMTSYTTKKHATLSSTKQKIQTNKKKNQLHNRKKKVKI